MFDLETIKFMNSSHGSARIRKLARAANGADQDKLYPKHNTGRKPVRKRKAARV